MSVCVSIFWRKAAGRGQCLGLIACHTNGGGDTRGKEGVSAESMRRNIRGGSGKTCHRLVEVVLLLEGSAVAYCTCGHGLRARTRQRGRRESKQDTGQIARDKCRRETHTAVSQAKIVCGVNRKADGGCARMIETIRLRPSFSGSSRKW